jgi:hypothetical protein
MLDFLFYLNFVEIDMYPYGKTYLEVECNHVNDGYYLLRT